MLIWIKNIIFLSLLEELEEITYVEQKTKIKALHMIRIEWVLVISSFPKFTWVDLIPPGVSLCQMGWKEWILKLVQELVNLVHRDVWVTEFLCNSILTNSGRYWPKMCKFREVENDGENSFSSICSVYYPLAIILCTAS